MSDIAIDTSLYGESKQIELINKWLPRPTIKTLCPS